MYRISVLEKSRQRDGKPVEVLGFYNPKSKELVLNTERATYWQSVGAQPSESVKSVLKREPIHDLATGAYQYKAKTRAEKEQTREELLSKTTKNTKAVKKKAEAEANAAAEAKAEAEKPAEEASTEETPAA